MRHEAYEQTKQMNQLMKCINDTTWINEYVIQINESIMNHNELVMNDNTATIGQRWAWKINGTGNSNMR